MGGAGQPLDLQFHQALGGKADHLAQKTRIGALFRKRAKGHHLVGHRWILESGLMSQPDPIERIDDDHRKAARPLRRYLWARVRAASLHRATPRGGTRPLGLGLTGVRAARFSPPALRGGREPKRSSGLCRPPRTTTASSFRPCWAMAGARYARRMRNDCGNHIPYSHYVGAFSQFKLPVFVESNGPDLTPRDDIHIRDTAPVILRTSDGA